MGPEKMECPAAAKPKVGDLVEIVYADEFDQEFFSVGDKARIVVEDGSCWEADFTMNPEYEGNGMWWIQQENLKVISHPA